MRAIRVVRRRVRKEEYSPVPEGRLGALIGEDVVYGEPGDQVSEPRHRWLTFWNAGAGPCRVLEIVSPAGFERPFAEAATDGEAMAGETAAAIDARYGLEVDNSTARLGAAHGPVFPA